MVDAFKNALTPEIRSNATAAGLSIRQLVTLASLVEKETGTAPTSARWWRRCTPTG